MIGMTEADANDERLRRSGVDEERTRGFDPEFAEHLKRLDEYRKSMVADRMAAKTPSAGRTTGDTRWDFAKWRNASGLSCSSDPCAAAERLTAMQDQAKEYGNGIKDKSAHY